MMSDWGPAASRVVLLSLIALVAWLGQNLFDRLGLPKEVHLPRLTLLILLGLVAVLVVVLLKALLATTQ